MAYIPISASSGTSSDSESGIAVNNSRRFGEAGVGVANIFTDYVQTLAPEGDFLKIIGTSVLINSIRNLLLTPIGSYPFDSTYGSDLYKKVFDPADEFTAEEIELEVVGRIQQFDSRVNVSNVFTEFFSNKKGFRINVTISRDAAVTEVAVDITEDLGFSLEEGGD